MILLALTYNQIAILIFLGMAIIAMIIWLLIKARRTKKLDKALLYKELNNLEKDKEYHFFYRDAVGTPALFTIPKDKIGEHHGYATKFHFQSGKLKVVVEVIDRNGFQLFYSELDDVREIKVL